MSESSPVRDARRIAGLTMREMALARRVSTHAVEQLEARGPRIRRMTYVRYVQAARALLLERYLRLGELLEPALSPEENTQP